jgi:hypothetical protein
MDKKSRGSSHKSDAASQYSEDFIDQSQQRSSKKSSPDKKLSSHQNTLQDEVDEESISENYSNDGFDRS